MMNTPNLLTVDQYADSMQVSRRTVLRWIDRKQLVYRNIAPAGSTRRIIRIPSDALVTSVGNRPQAKESVMLPQAKKVHV
jgi:excisionase family DNA binding protein